MPALVTLPDIMYTVVFTTETYAALRVIHAKTQQAGISLMSPFLAPFSTPQ